MGMSLSKLQEMVIDKEDWCAAIHGVTKSLTPEQLNNNEWLPYGYSLYQNDWSCYSFISCKWAVSPPDFLLQEMHSLGATVNQGW